MNRNLLNLEGTVPQSSPQSSVSPKTVRVWLTPILACALGSGLSVLGCTADQKQNPDELKEKTAETTAALKRDAKSVAEGVKEGWSRDQHRLDLNTATKEELVGIGLTPAQSNHVIEHRPYARPEDLLNKHVLSEDDYKQIEPHVRTGEQSDH